ncbi:hypothetical protein [Campylobacter ureolyticus]|uniref:Membrane protein n=2 Tax=Campylobacter ureolyticus TaxID=827 RepID=A0AAE7EAA3_9BACT|nr:hypothetical protein [Campylobacter ureolyticus]MCR8684795.1 hypothetical protein [Campylobacter ureolyticus]QKF84497.1 putative membrane protein [Campylobacter ureolyticus]QQY35345.1 hypothetical protein I6I59_07465 [Campylobacter ureolyticus]
MLNEKSQISLTKKRIFLVKVQVIIFLVGMTFAMYFGGSEALKSFNKIDIVDILLAAIFEALTKAIFYKIYILFFSIILVLKAFYFYDYKLSKKYLFGMLLNLLPIYICLVNLYTLNNLYISLSIYLTCIFIYLCSISAVDKFYKLINEIPLFKSFLYINFSTIFMAVLYIGLLYDNYAIKGKELGFFIALLGIVVAIFLPLSIWLSVPLNLISEYKYFRKDLKATNEEN